MRAADTLASASTESSSAQGAGTAAMVGLTCVSNDGTVPVRAHTKPTIRPRLSATTCDRTV